MMSDLLSLLWTSKKEMSLWSAVLLGTFLLYFIGLGFHWDTKYKCKWYFFHSDTGSNPKWVESETVVQTERVKEAAWQTEGGHGGWILLWQPFHFLWATFSFFIPPDPPTLRILWDFKASISSWAEWFGPGYCVNLEYSSGKFLCPEG